MRFLKIASTFITIISVLFPSSVLSISQKEIDRVVVNWPYNNCTKLQNRFNVFSKAYSDKNPNTNKVVFVGFESVQMKFENSDIYDSRDRGNRICIGGYTIESTPVGKKICSGFIHRYIYEKKESFLYSYGETIGNLNESERNFCRWKD
jgi:hypothetical protein